MYQSRLILFIASSVLLLTGIGCANRPPVLNCVADPATLMEGRTTTIQSNATDPDRRDQLTFNWQSTQGRLTPHNDTAVFDASGLAPGNYPVSLEVRDEKQHVATCEVVVAVERNRQPPTIACEPSSVRVTEGQSTTVSVDHPQSRLPGGDRTGMAGDFHSTS